MEVEAEGTAEATETSLLGMDTSCPAVMFEISVRSWFCFHIGS